MERLQVLVVNDEPGMRAGVARLLNDFVLIRDDRGRHVPGRGPGLSIVQKIAAPHEGEVSATGRQDAGGTGAAAMHRQRPEAP